MQSNNELFQPLIPGGKIPGDWFQGRIPENIRVGERTVIDSSFAFKHFFSSLPVSMRIGNNVTLFRTALSTEENGYIEIGDNCYLSNAALVCASKISIGSRVFIAGGVTIADSDFHPVSPAARIADTIALSPLGDFRHRPPVKSAPVTIGDDVWIGYNATILKGVHIGPGATVCPGALVTAHVAAGSTVAGNPAKPVNETA